MIHPSLQHLSVALDALTPDPENARVHTDRNLDAIAGSLSVYGQRKPIVVQRDGMIVRAGNGTVEAARRLGWTEIAAVVVDEADIRAAAYGLADNRTAELASWDDVVLARVLGRVSGEASPQDLFAMTGFDAATATRLQAALDHAESLGEPEGYTSRPNDAGMGTGTLPAPPVYTRMVQLFLPDADAHAAFMADLRAVAAKHGCTTATDSVQAAVAACLSGNP